MVKRGLNFVILFVFALFLIGFVSSASCSITTSCAPSNTVMKLYLPTNAHGALWDGGYNFSLCCDFTGDHSCVGSGTGNTVLRLNSSTNSHAEVPSGTIYTSRVCFSTLSCTSTTSSSCPSNFSIEMVSLSNYTNAHISEFNDLLYTTKICCAPNLGVSCGNGIINVGEGCDDGNVNNLDGCSYPTCAVNPGFTCVGQPSICTPICGNGTCSNGETCSSCVADCGCGTGYECSAGSCVALCDLTSATWNMTNATAGQPVRLNIAGTNCNGKTINFVIEEYDWSGGHDPVITNPSPIAFPVSGTTTYTTWTSEWQSEGLGETNPPEYFFTAGVAGYSELIPSSNPRLEVYESNLCGNGIVNPGETCSTCLADVPCQTGYECYSGSCVLECTLSNKVWNVSNAMDGQQVQLTVSGTNCNGYNISFPVFEYDLVGEDYAVQYNPINSIMTGGQATTKWIAEWPGYGDNDPSPEYYFIPTINGLGKSLTGVTPRISVVQNLYCGDGIVTSPERCDGSNLNGATCLSELGTGWTGTPGCNSDCTLNTSLIYCTPPPGCVIYSARWNTANVLEGNQVQLIIQTVNCNNGETVSFEIKEDDTGVLSIDDNVNSNPATVSINLNSATGSWIAEWQDDDGGILSAETNPPEYYFTATILSNGKNLQSSDPKLNVTQSLDAQCSAIEYCVGYTTEESCEADNCSVGINSVPGTILCGGSFNSETGCYDYTNCGCAWDDSSGCGPSWDEESSCGVCGNSIIDYPNERCDDGNTVGGDGCSADCLSFDDNLDPPCSEGLTLCNDGTCSLNCYSTNEGVASCNYDNVCQSGEGCTCIDCDSEQDACEEGLVCTIFNYGCCSFIRDYVCNPYCSYVDPDCSLGTECGNGFMETGEECDLGIRNLVANSGCSSTCELVIINETLNNGCPEGTAFCTDGTCSLNCYYTDEGVNDGDFTHCQTGLVWSIVDQACCDGIEDTYCNQYCAYTDPDCVAQQTIDGFSIGTCSYTETSTEDTCEDDNMLIRSLSAFWTWDADNNYTTNPDGLNYWQPTGSGVFRYDPIDYSGVRKSQKCDNVQDTLVCPASVEVSFFGVYSFVSTIIIVILIYYIISLIKKKNASIEKLKKKKRINKKDLDKLL